MTFIKKALKVSIYIYIYIYMYNMYIYIYIYIGNHENNEPSQLSPQSVGHTKRKWCAQVREFGQSHWGDNWEGTLISWLHIYIMLILLLWDLSTLCVVYYLWPLICKSIYIYICKSKFTKKYHSQTTPSSEQR